MLVSSTYSFIWDEKRKFQIFFTSLQPSLRFEWPVILRYIKKMIKYHFAFPRRHSLNFERFLFIPAGSTFGGKYNKQIYYVCQTITNGLQHKYLKTLPCPTPPFQIRWAAINIVFIKRSTENSKTNLIYIFLI